MISLVKKIDECNYNSVNIKFYDGIDLKYASEYNGEDMLIFFVDNWDKELKRQKRENVINGILYDSSINNLNFSSFIAVYQTNGYLMETLIAVKNRMKREHIGMWSTIAKK